MMRLAVFFRSFFFCLVSSQRTHTETLHTKFQILAFAGFCLFSWRLVFLEKKERKVDDGLVVLVTLVLAVFLVFRGVAIHI